MTTENNQNNPIDDFAHNTVGIAPDDFEAVKSAVYLADRTDMTGAQKKQAVLNMLGNFGVRLVTVVANVAVELAVMWLRQKMAAKING